MLATACGLAVKHAIAIHLAFSLTNDSEMLKLH